MRHSSDYSTPNSRVVVRSYVCVGSVLMDMSFVLPFDPTNGNNTGCTCTVAQRHGPRVDGLVRSERYMYIPAMHLVCCESHTCVVGGTASLVNQSLMKCA